MEAFESLNRRANDRAIKIVKISLNQQKRVQAVRLIVHYDMQRCLFVRTGHWTLRVRRKATAAAATS